MNEGPLFEPVKAILFDKDGCLCDFAATWNAWAAQQIDVFAAGNAEIRRRLAKELFFDLETKRFLPESPVIAGTNQDTADCIARALNRTDVAHLLSDLERAAEMVDIVEVVPLNVFLPRLAQRGMSLAVVTNDSERVARAQMRGRGVETLFSAITGADSGYGAKPSPEPLLATAQLLGVEPQNAVMVGDSPHDLLAGRAAGMRTVAVLTGLAVHDDLSAHADVVLPDIGHIPAWLDQLAGSHHG